VAYRNVVVGTDGSTTAEKAVREAAGLAADHEARLVVVTAYEAHGDPMADDEATPKDLRWMLTDRSQAEEVARRGAGLAHDGGATSVSVEAIAGSAADVLLEAAVDRGADCIVVGSKGLTSHAHFVLGSVASSVAHHAPCDVLIVHTTS
jgi:nucleotide-binding universal stress UspA family protein